MINGKFLKQFIIFFFSFILVLILAIFLLVNWWSGETGGGAFRNDESTGAATTVITATTTTNRADESGNNFPFALSAAQINQSLSQNQEISISPVGQNWPEEINGSLLNNNWRLIGVSRANDGGSVFYYYFKTKDVPALALGYHWNITAGEYQRLSINFISPTQIGAWLLKIKPALNEDLSIESLMR